MLPNNTITKTFFLAGNLGNVPIDETANAKTILGVNIGSLGNAKTIKLKCGGVDIYQNIPNDTPYVEMAYKCNDVLIVNKIGTSDAQLVVNYIMGDYALPPPDPVITYTYTEGELVGSLFLFGIMLILLFDLVYRQFVGNRIKRLSG